MINSILIGAVAGSRSMTPLAAVSLAAATRRLPDDNGAPAILANPWVAAGTALLAAGELAGDKMKSAPDRTVLAALLPRLVTGAIAGMSLAPHRSRHAGAALGVAAAAAASFLTSKARIASMRHHGQLVTGLVEDATVLAHAAAIVSAAGRKSA